MIAAVRSTRYPACGVLAVCAQGVERHWQAGTVHKGKHYSLITHPPAAFRTCGRKQARSRAQRGCADVDRQSILAGKLVGQPAQRQRLQGRPVRGKGASFAPKEGPKNHIQGCSGPHALASVLPQVKYFFGLFAAPSFSPAHTRPAVQRASGRYVLRAHTLLISRVLRKYSLTTQRDCASAKFFCTPAAWPLPSQPFQSPAQYHHEAH